MCLNLFLKWYVAKQPAATTKTVTAAAMKKSAKRMRIKHSNTYIYGHTYPRTHIHSCSLTDESNMWKQNIN